MTFSVLTIPFVEGGQCVWAPHYPLELGQEHRRHAWLLNDRMVKGINDS